MNEYCLAHLISKAPLWGIQFWNLKCWRYGLLCQLWAWRKAKFLKELFHASTLGSDEEGPWKWTFWNLQLFRLHVWIEFVKVKHGPKRHADLILWLGLLQLHKFKEQVVLSLRKLDWLMMILNYSDSVNSLAAYLPNGIKSWISYRIISSYHYHYHIIISSNHIESYHHINH